MHKFLIMMLLGFALSVLGSTIVYAGYPNCKGIPDSHCKSARAGDEWQCTTFVQQNAGWSVGKLGTTLEEKKKMINSNKPVEGAVVVMNVGSYGHVGLVRKVKGSTITVEDRNACCDGEIRKYEMSADDKKIEGYITSGDNKDKRDEKKKVKYSIRISNIDDEGTCKVNGDKVKTVGYYEDSGWIDITDKLRSGKNEIEFKVKEKGGGYAYRFEVQKDGKTIWEESCGEVGKKGCSKKKLDKGDSLKKEYKFKL